jgi:hypothetical protein
LDYGILSALNVAFFAHPVVAMVAKEMKRPTRNRVLASTWIANILCAIVLYLIPALGYLTGQLVDDGENVFHYLDPWAVEVIAGQIAVMISMFCSEFFFAYLMGRCVAGQIYTPAENHGIPVGVSAFAMSALALCINFLGDQGLGLFYGIALISFSVVGFVLPPVYYFAQYGNRHTGWSIVAGLVLVIGGGMMIISFYLTIADVMAL